VGRRQHARLSRDRSQALIGIRLIPMGGKTPYNRSQKSGLSRDILPMV
jgi:hypothetical protein